MRLSWVIRSADRICIQSIDLLILHNYDIFLGYKKKRNQLYRLTAKRVIMMIQCDLDDASNGPDITKRAINDISLLCGGDMEWKKRTMDDVREANLLRGVECSVEKVEWKFSPLQSLLLKRCSNTNLKLLISIHPLLILDNKLDCKAEQQVADESWVNCRN